MINACSKKKSIFKTFLILDVWQKEINCKKKQSFKNIKNGVGIKIVDKIFNCDWLSDIKKSKKKKTFYCKNAGICASKKTSVLILSKVD